MFSLERMLINLKIVGNLKPLLLTPDKCCPAAASTTLVRNHFIDRIKKKPGLGGYFRRRVHYPEKYTIEPIPYTNLGGRDPETGQRIVKTLGGGVKWPLLWCDYTRNVDPKDSPLTERVLEIVIDRTRSAHLALVGHKDKLRYIIATENMKAGDLIVTSSEITRSAVRPNEGDAYPLGSLPLGSVVCNVECFPRQGGQMARAAGTFCTVLRKMGEKIVIQRTDKHEIALDKNCIAVVGRVSNKIHSSLHIGTAQGIRHLGYRPRSGLWQRKTGKHGRKIRRLPPVVEMAVKPPGPLRMKLTLPDEYPKQLSEVFENIRK